MKKNSPSPSRGLKKQTPPHYMTKSVSHSRGSFDSLNELFWWSPFSEQRRRKTVFLKKINLFLDFFKKWTFQLADIFVVAITASKHFI